MLCKFCSKECKNDNSLRNHERCCPSNPNRNYKNGMTGKSAWNKGLTKADDPRIAQQAESVSKSTKGKPSNTFWTPEMIKAKSEWRKQLHKDFPEMHPNRKLAGNRNKMSYPEKVAFDFLTKNNIEFDHQKQVDKFFPDFVVGNIIIEIDGARWHNEEKDLVRDSILVSHGYKVFRIQSTENIESRLGDILCLG